MIDAAKGSGVDSFIPDAIVERMNILLPPNDFLFYLSMAIMLPVLVIAIRYAPWRLLLAEQTRQHFFYGTIIVLAVLWTLQIKIKGIIAFHPLLITVVTMLFGWCFALVIGCAALTVMKILQFTFRSGLQGMDVAWSQFNFAALPADFCLSVLIPATWALLIIGLVNRWKFKNPFTYFWGVGFFGAMISCLIMGLAAIGLFSLSNSELALASVQENFIVFFVLTFPEGFINGSIATMFTIFWPGIVKTYRDDWFLKD